MAEWRFDDRAVTWQMVPFIGAEIYVLAVDAARGIADVLIRFAPDVIGRLHRHVTDFSTFVLQGELRFWHADGTFKELRPVASCVIVKADGPPHREGAGDVTAIVLFSFRGGTGDMIHYIDDDGTIVFRLGFADFAAAYAAQIESGAAARLAPRTG